MSENQPNTPVKFCKCCSTSHPLSHFSKDSSKKDGLRTQCTSCRNAYVEKNRGKLREYGRNYNRTNKHVRDQWKAGNADRYRKSCAAYQRKRRKDPLYNLVSSVRRSTHRALNGIIKKSKSSEKYLGCTFEFFLDYIQKQFEYGMTLENYGDWEIDHIKPINTGLSDDEVKEVLHYSNCRPLWKEANRNRPHDGSDVAWYPPR